MHLVRVSVWLLSWQIFMLMKSDSYPRFINSSMYKDRLECGPAADPEMVIAVRSKMNHPLLRPIAQTTDGT